MTTNKTNEQLIDFMATKVMKWEIRISNINKIPVRYYVNKHDGFNRGSCIDFKPTTNLLQAMECFDKIPYGVIVHHNRERRDIYKHDYEVRIGLVTIIADTFKDLAHTICVACAEAMEAK